MFKIQRGRSRGLIRLNHSGAEFVLDESGFQFTWNSIGQIYAFKQDMFGFDTICFGIVLDGREEPLILTEDDEGFSNFCSEIEVQLGLGDGWYARVVHPPFAPNLECIYTRK